jgi:hypothetical protein
MKSNPSFGVAATKIKRSPRLALMFASLGAKAAAFFARVTAFAGSPRDSSIFANDDKAYGLESSMATAF